MSQSHKERGSFKMKGESMVEMHRNLHAEEMNLPLEMNKKGAIWSRARKGPALEKNFFGLAYMI